VRDLEGPCKRRENQGYSHRFGAKWGMAYIRGLHTPEEVFMSRKPQLILSSLDVDRLEALLEAMPASAFPGKADLEAEIARADIVEPTDIPPDVVTMNSTVNFDIAESGKQFQLTLVYPKDLDDTSSKISVFAPVGSALLGLSIGNELAWPSVGGKTMTVRVTGISYQPERAGDLHR